MFSSPISYFKREIGEAEYGVRGDVHQGKGGGGSIVVGV